MKLKISILPIIIIALCLGGLITFGIIRSIPQDNLGGMDLWKYVNSRLQPVVSTWDTQVEDLIASGSLTVDSTASISGTITFGNLISCDTIDSNANGLLVCGTDATGGAENTFTNPLSLVGTVVSIDLASASGGGYLSAANWTTFNDKQAALTFELPLVNISNTVSASYASAGDSGWLLSADWTTFNSKEPDVTWANLTVGGAPLTISGGTSAVAVATAITFNYDDAKLGLSGNNLTIDDIYLLNTGDEGTYASMTVGFSSVEANITSLSANTYWGAGLIDCDTANTSKVLWSDTGIFSCGTDYDTNTTYTAGDNLTLTGTDFDVDDPFTIVTFLTTHASISDDFETNQANITSASVSGTLNATTLTEAGIAIYNANEMDTYAELNAIVADVTLTHNGLIDTYAELNAIVADVTLTHNGLIDTFAELDALVADKALVNKADGAVWLGVHDFGGATSFKFPVGTAPSITANGMGAIDITGGQFLFYSDEVNVLMATMSFGFTMSSGAFDGTNSLVKNFQEPATITAINCAVTTATSKQVELIICADTTCADTGSVDSSITAAVTSTWDDGSLASASIQAGDWVQASVSQGDVSGTPNWLTCTVYYKWTVQ